MSCPLWVRAIHSLAQVPPTPTPVVSSITGIKSRVLTGPTMPLRMLFPHPGWFLPQISMSLACFCCSSSPSPFPSLYSTPLLWSSWPKRNGPGSTSYSCLWSLFSGGIIFYFVILWGFLYVIYFRFVGEKRAPQKKVLSWRRQRMQESRCRSRSTNSLNPEISTTTCAGPPLPGSGILRSRCASFYSKTHPHSL